MWMEFDGFQFGFLEMNFCRLCDVCLFVCLRRVQCVDSRVLKADLEEIVFRSASVTMEEPAPPPRASVSAVQATPGTGESPGSERSVKYNT